MTGSNVGCPFDPVVLNHIFFAQSGLVVYSMEKPGGEAVSVLVTGIAAMQAGHGEHRVLVVTGGREVGLGLEFLGVECATLMALAFHLCGL